MSPQNINEKENVQHSFFADKRNMYSLVFILLCVAGLAYYWMYKKKEIMQTEKPARQMTEMEQKIISELDSQAQKNKPSYQDIVKMEAALKTSAAKSTNYQYEQEAVNALLNKR